MASPWEKGTWNSGEKKDARSVKRVRAGRQRYAYRHTQRHAPNLKFKFGTSHGTASYTGYSHTRARDVLARVRAMEEKGSKKEDKQHEEKKRPTTDTWPFSRRSDDPFARFLFSVNTLGNSNSKLTLLRFVLSSFRPVIFLFLELVSAGEPREKVTA